MPPERYKSQSEVFFLATVALFPEKLTEQPLNPWFHGPYFNFSYDFHGNENEDTHLEWADVIMSDYRNKGYIDYTRVNGLFKITKINTKGAAEELARYLKKWEENQLISFSANKPPDAELQKRLLPHAIAQAYINNPAEPRLTFKHVYGNPGDQPYEPPFWELVLSYQLLDKKVEIIRADYDRRVDGLYDKRPQPYVDLGITDEELAELIKQLVATSNNPTLKEPVYLEVKGLLCDFIFDDEKGIRHSDGAVVCESKWGNRHRLASFLMQHKKVTDVAGAKRDSGKSFTLKELRNEFPQISEVQRDLKRISDSLKNSVYANRICLTLPESVTANTTCQIECRQ